jgi:hypothetical protein
MCSFVFDWYVYFCPKQTQSNTMKKAILAFGKISRLAGAAVMIAFLSFSVTSCSTEGCTDSTATNYDEKADEDDGSCTYEREAILGSYSVSGTIACGETGNTTVTGAILAITESTTATNKVVITLASELALTATLAGTTFTFDNQTVDGYVYSGNGTVSGNAINVTINEYDGSIPETCVYTLNGSRQ